MSRKDTRDSLLQFCQDLSQAEFIVEDSIKCWLQDFDKQWIDRSTDNADFNKAVLTWLQNTTEGRRATVSRQVAVKDDGSVFYASFSAKAKLGETTLGSPRKEMY